MKESTYNNFEEIVLNQTPLIDVRAPIEFLKGAFCTATNLPLMDDEQRRLVGICYKEKGNAEAVKLGHSLVNGQIKKQRILAWKAQLEKEPESKIYCFRGGQRSQITQQWIKEETGKEVLRLEGGYKAFRNYLIEQLEPRNQKSVPLLLGGCTGSGKTLLIHKLQNAIDLEGIANHRGSAFGNHISSQPTQIDFENRLAYALITHKHQNFSHIVLEDEGSHIGKCFIPKPLANYFKEGKLVVLRTPLEERVHLTTQEYVNEAQKAYEKVQPEKGLSLWAQQMRESLKKIQKRLGGDRYQYVLGLFEEAYQTQQKSQDFSKHETWVAFLLSDYYDPMYEYQLAKMKDKIIFEGNANEVFSYLQHQS